MQYSIGYQVSLVVSSRFEDRDSHARHWGALETSVWYGALMGTSAFSDVGTHQPVVALDRLYPVTGR